jgi:uncharacterized protein YjlB
MSITTEVHWSKPKGMLPNSRFPLLVHRGAVPGGGEDAMVARLRANGWFTRRRMSASAVRGGGWRSSFSA